MNADSTQPLSPATALPTQPAANLRQVIRYLLVGAWNTIFGYAVYALFTYILTGRVPYAYLAANLLSNVIAITVAFFGYKLFVFKTKGNYLREYLRVYLVYGASALTSFVLLPVLVALVGLLIANAALVPYIAGALTTPLIVAFSYIGHKHFSFRRAAERPPGHAAEAGGRVATRGALEAVRTAKRRARRLAGRVLRKIRRCPARELPPEEQLHAAGRMLGARRRPTRGPWVVGGLFTSTLGLGEGARLFYSALKRLGAEPLALNLSDAFPLHDRCTFDFGSQPQPDDGGVLVIHLNAPEVPLALLSLGRRQVRRRRLVGYWHWELPQIPPSWRSSFALLDEIWAPTRFVAQAIAPHTSLPVHVVCHPVTPYPPAALSRADFGVHPRATLFLCIADALSSLGRKNIGGVIAAFQQAFGANREAQLVLKITHADRAPGVLTDLTRKIGGAANIRLILESMSKERLAALVDHADVIVSLHRSEGFGLVLAEGMLAGKPVIATGYSGNVDFTSPANAALVAYKLVPVHDPQGVYNMPGQQWAEPDLDQAAALMQRLAQDATERDRLGRAAQESVARTFGLEAFARALGATSVGPYLDSAAAAALARRTV